MGAHKIWTTLTSGLGCLGWEIEKYEDKEETADEDTKLQDCHDCTNTNITKLRVTRLHKRPRMSGDGWILCWKSFILSVESVTIGCGYDLIIYQYLAPLLRVLPWALLFWQSEQGRRAKAEGEQVSGNIITKSKSSTQADNTNFEMLLVGEGWKERWSSLSQISFITNSTFCSLFKGGSWESWNASQQKGHNYSEGEECW